MLKANTKFFYFICLITCILSDLSFYGQPSTFLYKTQEKSDNIEYQIITDKSPCSNSKTSNLNLNNTNSQTNKCPVLFCEQTFWCYFKTPSNTENSEVYTIKCPNTIELKIFSAIKNGTSYSLKIIQIPYASKNGYFAFELPKNSSQTIIKIKTTQYITFGLKGRLKSYIFKNERFGNIYFGILLGVLVLLFLYHCILYFIVREKLYFFYVLYVALSVIYIIVNCGLFLNPHHIYNQITFVTLQIGTILIYLSYRRFAFLNSKNILKYLNIIPLPIILGIYSVVSPSFASNLLLYFFSVILVLIFIISVSAYYKKTRNISLLFLLSWIGIFIGQIFFFIRSLFESNDLFFLDHAYELGLLTNIVLLSLAIGNRLNIYKDEKKQAELSEIKALMEKDKFVHEQNLMLKKLINERNKELLDKIEISLKQKQEIESQNEIINNRIKEIELINDELIQKNIEISNQNIELEKHHKILEETVDKRTKKLNKAREKAIIADKLKTSFLNNLTQEISTPMNAITGYSSLITDKGLTKETRNEYLNKILRYVDILLETVDNIVILSRIQAGIIKPRITEIGLTELLYNVQSIFSEKIKNSNKRINIQTVLPPISNDLLIKSDKDKIMQILNILFDLIMKQKFEGDLKIVIEIKVKTDTESKKKDKLIFHLTFSKSELVKEKIFQAFEQYLNNPSTSLKYNNPIELGIAIIKGLLRISKAKLKIQNTENDGFMISSAFPVLFSNVENKTVP